MSKQYKDLKDLNHMLNLNYDTILNDDLIDNARVAMLMLANHIEEVWNVYKEEGYYVDNEGRALLNETYKNLFQLSNKLSRLSNKK